MRKSRQTGPSRRLHHLRELDPESPVRWHDPSLATARLGLPSGGFAAALTACSHHAFAGRIRTMLTRSLAGAALALALCYPTSAVFAAAADYEFQPLKVDVKNGSGSELAVRLIHKPSGKPVTGAVLFRTRLDMAPDNMADMTGKHEAMPSSEAGVYRFKADLTMAGGWAFRVMAKVPGETDTVQGVVVFQAKD
jgi:hypothetical protein